MLVEPLGYAPTPEPTNKCERTAAATAGLNHGDHRCCSERHLA